jgi:hypothetical protein
MMNSLDTGRRPAKANLLLDAGLLAAIYWNFCCGVRLILQMEILVFLKYAAEGHRFGDRSVMAMLVAQRYLVISRQ